MERTRVLGSADMTQLSFYKNTSLHICAKRVTQRNSAHYPSGCCTGPQPAAFHLFTCSISRALVAAPLPPSDVHGQNLNRGKKSKIIHRSSAPERLHAHLCREGSDRCVPTPGACSSSCRLITARHKLQNSPDLLGCLKESPKLSLFFSLTQILSACRPSLLTASKLPTPWRIHLNFY